VTTEIAFEPHPGRGRFNAVFFNVTDSYIDRKLRLTGSP
jgi:hypothetical protein